MRTSIQRDRSPSAFRHHPSRRLSKPPASQLSPTPTSPRFGLAPAQDRPSPHHPRYRHHHHYLPSSTPPPSSLGYLTAGFSPPPPQHLTLAVFHSLLLLYSASSWSCCTSCSADARVDLDVWSEPVNNCHNDLAVLTRPLPPTLPFPFQRRNLDLREW